ncbi:MAG: hypothetical protein II913_05795 [Elusimicrobiaceae bacterium]|nr:hypothetical protein [Elusimicrobiaceae bacterium]
MAQKTVVCKLDGKEYTLKFSMRVPLLWEQSTGKNYFEAFGVGAKPSLVDILTLVWAAFRNGGCTLTLDELADKLNDKDLNDLSSKIMKLAEDNSTKEQGEKGGSSPLEQKPQN